MVGKPYDVGGEDSSPIPVGEYTGSCTPVTGVYPPGPYGVGAGDVIENFPWSMGMSDPSNHCKDHAAKELDTRSTRSLALSDWYQEAAPDNPQWRTKDRLRVLFDAGWNAESRTRSTDLQQAYQSGQIDARTGVIQVLVAGDAADEVPDVNYLLQWVTDFSITFPVGIDGADGLSRRFGVLELPNELVIDLGNMTIIEAPKPPTGCTPLSVPYPTGTFGRRPGNIAYNISVPGFADPEHHCKTHPEKEPDTSTAVDIAVADWYAAARPPASQVAEKTELTIIISTGWCSTCQQETKRLAQKYRSGQIAENKDYLEVLLETDWQGQVATEAFARKWIEAFDVPFPVVADVSSEFDRKYDVSYFPTLFTIDLQTMKILEVK
jgi:hypothetical protein